MGQLDNTLHYRPVQPGVRDYVGVIHYQEFTPAPCLRPFILCYWQLKTINPLPYDFEYRVVADGCIDIFFDLQQGQESYVAGFSKHYSMFPLGRHFQFAGIRFLPGAFPRLFHVSAGELTARVEPLALISNHAASNLRKLEEVSLQGLAQKLDDYFTKLLLNAKPTYDKRFDEALSAIISQHQKIEDIDTGISARQLRRMFDHYVGCPPKVFSQVVRFQQLLRGMLASNRPSMFFDVGYYDQAHFVKSFKTFYGLTPTEAFRR